MDMVHDMHYLYGTVLFTFIRNDSNGTAVACTCTGSGVDRDGLGLGWRRTGSGALVALAGCSRVAIGGSRTACRVGYEAVRERWKYGFMGPGDLGLTGSQAGPGPFRPDFISQRRWSTVNK